jgi:hypothetical protein
MAATLDLTDVTPVAPQHMALMMGLLIESGRALMLVRGATPDDKKAIEALFWDRFEGETADGVATLLRFWSLSGVFSSRRLKGVLLARGFAVLAPAGEVAARLRFNVHWGFNPQRFLTALTRAGTSRRNAGETEAAAVLAA